MNSQPFALPTGLPDKSAAAPSADPGAVRTPSLYRVVWRWHFYAGALVAPVLFVVAVTGGLYVFKDELDRVMYPKTMFVSPRSEAVPLERQVAAAEAAYPGAKADTVEVETDPTKATSIRVRGGTVRLQRVYVGPHTGPFRARSGTIRFSAWCSTSTAGCLSAPPGGPW